MRTKHQGAGYGTTLTIMRFQKWADSLREFPTYLQVMDKFGCHSATAHRWLQALADARGIVRPRCAHGRQKAA